MSQGHTVEEAYVEAMAMSPQCFESQGYGSCMRFAGEADFTLAPVVYRVPAIEVSVDIRPSSYPNRINLKSKGKILVAILSTDDFDAHDVDPVTCEFAGVYPLRWNTEDVNYDGGYDMLFHFMT